MKNLSNDYEKLLHYLEHQKVQKGRGEIVRKEKPKPKPKQKEVKKKPQQVDTTKSKREAAKKLIEESQIHSYIPNFAEQKKKTPKKRKSAGFDVQKFESMMRARLIDDHKRLQSYERPYISVTEICGCLRQSYYVRMRYPVNLNEQYRFSYLYMIQKVGNEVHNIMLELYNFSEIEKTVVSEKYKVKGRIDGVKGSFLYEIKSIDADKFNNRYLEEHYEQALIYAYILNTEYDYNIKTVVIIYVIRNLKHIIPFDIQVDNDRAKSLLSRAVVLKSSLDKSNVPDPIGARSEQCKYCLHKKYCVKDECAKVVQPFARGKNKQKNQNKDDPKKPVFLM